MPQTGQIIPNYLHPHVMTIINDNTEIRDAVAAATGGLRSIFVFTSPKGRANEILEINSAQAFIEEYGRPNHKQFGQPAYNAYAFLSGGKTKAWCLRVMPDDATYSNLVIVAKVKVDTSTPASPKLNIRFEAVRLNGVTEPSDVPVQVNLLTNVDPDVNGYKTYPLIAFHSQGKGIYGDGFRVRISGSPQSDKENGYKNHRIEVLELQNTVDRKEAFTGSAFVDALVGMTSLFLEDKINDAENGSNKVTAYFVSDNFSAIYNTYKTSVRPNTTLTEATFDLLTGETKMGQNIDGLVYDKANANYVALDNPAGIPLSGGNDGAFTYSTATLGARELAINTAYANAFKGDVDRAILSRRRTPAEFIFDAGYADEVKRELIALIAKRYDAYGFIDGGILNSLTEALAWGETMVGLGDRILSKDFQHYRIRDPFSGKNIPVTTTFLLARALPAHFDAVGSHIPFVGETYAPLTGAIKNSLTPKVDADDSETKEALYELRMNYFQTLAENTYVRATQVTSQNIWSDLSEENNMFTLLDMKRKLEDLVASVTYSFADAEERQRFTEDANRLFEGYAGTKIESADVSFQMSQYEEERSILHCYLGVVYRTLAKRAIVEIDINPRA